MQTAQAVFRGALDDAEFYADRSARDRTRQPDRTARPLCSTPSNSSRSAAGKDGSTSTSTNCGPSPVMRGGDFGYAITRYLLRPATSTTRCASTARLSRHSRSHSDETCSSHRRCTTSRSLPRDDGDVTTAEVLYDALLPYADCVRQHDDRKAGRLALARSLRRDDGKGRRRRSPVCAGRSPSTSSSARRCSAPRARSNSPACSTPPDATTRRCHCWRPPGRPPPPAAPPSSPNSATPSPATNPTSCWQGWGPAGLLQRGA